MKTKLFILILCVFCESACGHSAEQVTKEVQTWAEFGKSLIDTALFTIKEIKSKIEALKSTHTSEEMATPGFSDPELTKLNSELQAEIDEYNRLVDEYNSHNPKTPLEHI